MAHSILKILSFVLLFNSISVDSFAQRRPDREINMKEVVVKSNRVEKRTFKAKKIGLYDSEEEELYNILGFNQLSIFEGIVTDEFWISPKVGDCISVDLKTDEESSFLSLEWDESQDACDWVGYGFGWSNWLGKDMLYVFDTLAIELVVRATDDDPLLNLPWAFGIEDYSGEQAWLGFNRKFLRSEKISKEWTRVEVPLSSFPFETTDINLRNVKQLLVQVFASGKAEIKSVRLIPFANKLKKQAFALSNDLVIAIDGKIDDWPIADFYTLEGSQHEFAVHYTEDSLFFAFNIKDDTPMENMHQGGSLWNGDAIEIAFSTNPNADPKRNYLLLSDQHIGLNCGENPYIWNWTEDNKVTNADFKLQKTSNGYSVEVGLPISNLSTYKLKKGEKLGLEVAIDVNKEKIRKEQLRWNSTYEEGFHLSPQKWGELILK